MKRHTVRANTHTKKQGVKFEEVGTTQRATLVPLQFATSKAQNVDTKYEETYGMVGVSCCCCCC